MRTLNRIAVVLAVASWVQASQPAGDRDPAESQRMLIEAARRYTPTYAARLGGLLKDASQLLADYQAGIIGGNPGEPWVNGEGKWVFASKREKADRVAQQADVVRGFREQEKLSREKRLLVPPPLGVALAVGDAGVLEGKFKVDTIYGPTRALVRRDDGTPFVLEGFPTLDWADGQIYSVKCWASVVDTAKSGSNTYLKVEVVPRFDLSRFAG